MLLDYGDKKSINTGPDERNRKALEDAHANENRDFGGIQCIHGHFMPLKYLPLKKQKVQNLYAG